MQVAVTVHLISGPWILRNSDSKNWPVFGDLGFIRVLAIYTTGDHLDAFLAIKPLSIFKDFESL